MQPGLTPIQFQPRDVLLVSGYLLFSAVFLWMISCVSLTFPTPWPDESSFLWQAIAVQEHNQLFAPQLSAERDIMWMPPGYAVVMGVIFKLTGFTLPLARSISAGFVILSFGTVLLAFMRHKAAPWLLVLTGFFLLSSRVVLAGNFARMESLMMLQVFLGLLLITRGKWYPGLSLIALSPLVHPNGFHFCLPAAVWFLWHLLRRDRTLWPAPTDLLCIAIVLAAWGSYAWYVANHWADFVADMQFQAEAKNKLWRLYGGFTGQLGKVHNLFSIAILIPSLLLLRSSTSRFLILLSLSLLSLNIVSIGLTYAIFEAAAMLVSSILCILLLLDLVGRVNPGRVNPGSGVVQVIAAAATLSLVALQLHWGYLDNRPGDPAALAVEDVKADTTTPWITDEERNAVSDYLTSLPKSEASPITVMFLPSADGLVLNELRSSNTVFVTQTLQQRKVDIIIHHEHPAITARVSRLLQMLLMYQVQLLEGADFTTHEIFVKDKNTRWTAYNMNADS